MILFMDHELPDAARHAISRPLRCAVYARVSVEDTQDIQMPSIEVQTQACRAFIEAHRYQNWQVIDSAYADNGYSAGNLQRPALRRLLDDIQSDKIDVVVVQRLDRLSRSLFDLETLLSLFTIPGIRLVSVSQPLDTESSEGRLGLHLLTSFAQFERELIGERTREKLTAIDRCFQRTQTIDDGIEGGWLADEHAGTDHALEVIAQGGQCGIFRNEPELPGQACVVVGVARVVEDLFVLDDIREQSAIGHSGFPMDKIGQHG